MGLPMEKGHHFDPCCNFLSDSHRLTQTLLPSGYSLNKFNKMLGFLISLQPCNLSLKFEIKEPWKMLKCITNKANKEKEKKFETAVGKS